MKQRTLNFKKWATVNVAVVTTFSFISAGVAFATPPIGQFEVDDGTYNIQTVISTEACEALCKADSPKCRGSVIYQADTSKPEMLCRLNNGFGENAAFPRTPPETLDFDRALADLNAYRASKDLKALVYNDRLNRASEVHSRDIANAGIISHTGTDGSVSGDRIQRQGYYFSIAAENVATGQMNWADVFDGWKKSPGHNENLLRDDVSEFGLALIYEPTTAHSTYWTMLVAHPFDVGYTSPANTDEANE